MVKFRLIAAFLFVWLMAPLAHAGPEIVPEIKIEPTQSVPKAISASRLPADWHRRASFYEIFVRSYKDTNNDGIGDLNGITASLDELRALGVTGIWLMPIHPSQDNDHGYAVNDYRAIHKDYGSLADFDRLIFEAHKRGIGIILDYVINHAGSGHAYFQKAAQSPQSPYRDWFLFQPKGNWDRFAWHWRANPQGEGVYYGVFDSSMPDWNLKNEAVFQYHADNLRFWMDRGWMDFVLTPSPCYLKMGLMPFSIIKIIRPLWRA